MYLEFVSNSCHLKYQDREGRLIVVAIEIDVLVVIHTVIGDGTPLSLRLLLLRATPRGQDRDGSASCSDTPWDCRLGRPSAERLASRTLVGGRSEHGLALALI